MPIRTLHPAITVLSAFLLLAPTMVSAQGARQGPVTSPATAPASAMQQVIRAREALVTNIDRTMTVLQRAGSVNVGQITASQIDKTFLDLRNDVLQVLEQLDANGKLADEIGAAQTAAQRARGFWNRLEGNPDRQRMLEQLDRNISQFENSRRQMLDTRDEASRQLTLLIERQVQARRVAQTLQIDEAAKQLEEMVSSLRTLTESLASLEKTTNRPGAAN